MREVAYWVALSRIPKFGTVRFRKLEAFFGDLGHAWDAGLAGLKAAGIEDRVAQEFVEARKSLDPGREMERLEKAGTRALTWHDSEYPAMLKEIHDPPPVLYIKG